MDTEYNGWTNRETWAVSLYLDNDASMHNYFNGLIAEALTAEHLAEALQDWIVELLEESPIHNDQLRQIRNEIGSVWRVNFHEIAQAHFQDYRTSEPYPGAWRDSEVFAYNYGLDED